MHIVEAEPVRVELAGGSRLLVVPLAAATVAIGQILDLILVI